MLLNVDEKTLTKNRELVKWKKMTIIVSCIISSQNALLILIFENTLTIYHIETKGKTIRNCVKTSARPLISNILFIKENDTSG